MKPTSPRPRSTRPRRTADSDPEFSNSAREARCPQPQVANISIVCHEFSVNGIFKDNIFQTRLSAGKQGPFAQLQSPPTPVGGGRLVTCDQLDPQLPQPPPQRVTVVSAVGDHPLRLLPRTSARLGDADLAERGLCKRNFMRRGRRQLCGRATAAYG
jgi:hypothetical protein